MKEIRGKTVSNSGWDDCLFSDFGVLKGRMGAITTKAVSLMHRHESDSFKRGPGMALEREKV
jgi:hypothetical protein